MARGKKDDEVEEQVEDQVEEDAAPRAPWPLGEDYHGFYRGVRSRAYASEGQEVVALQDVLGVPKTGIYDDATAEAVVAFKGKNPDLTPGEVVDRATWEALTR